MSKDTEETKTGLLYILFWLVAHLLIAVLGVPAFILGFFWAVIAGGFAAGRLTLAALLVGSGVARAEKVKEVKEDE